MNPIVSKILGSLWFALIAAGLYLAVKYFTGRFTADVWWKVLAVVAIVGVLTSLPWRSTPKPPDAGEG